MLKLILHGRLKTGLHSYKCTDCSTVLQLTHYQASAKKACPTCYPTDTGAFKLWLSKNFSEAKFVSGKVTGRMSKVRIKFTECGHIWDTSVTQAHDRLVTLSNNEHYSECPTCQRANAAIAAGKTVRAAYATGVRASANRTFKTTSEYRAWLKTDRKLGLCPPYPPDVSLLVSLWHVCLVCGHEFKNSPGNIVHCENGCAKCAGCHSKTTSEYRQELSALSSKFLPVAEYNGSRTAITHKCTTCGYELVASPTNMLKPKYHSHCVVCDGDRCRNKAYTLGSRIVRVEGFEPFGLDYILKVKRIKPLDVRVQSERTVPKIWYKYCGWHEHTPDFFICSENRLVEVKSVATLGLLRPRDSRLRIPQGRKGWYKQVAKRRYARQCGYSYSLLLFDDVGSRIPLPSNWPELGYNQIRAYLKSLYPHLL